MSPYLVTNIQSKLSELGLSRDGLIFNAGIQEEDMASIDAGIKPTQSVLNKIATALGTNGMWLCVHGINPTDIQEDKKHFFELLGPVLTHMINETEHYVNPNMTYDVPNLTQP